MFKVLINEEEEQQYSRQSPNLIFNIVIYEDKTNGIYQLNTLCDCELCKCNHHNYKIFETNKTNYEILLNNDKLRFDWIWN